MEVCKYMVVLFFLPYDCYEKNGWIFRKYIRKSNCLKYYLLVCVSGNFCNKGNDDFFSNIIECNIGRNCSSDLNNNKREHKREYNVIFHNIKNHILVYNSHFINSV